MNMMKTIVIALAVLFGAAGVMAVEAKCDPKTGICEIPASGAEKVDSKKAEKADCKKVAKADCKKVAKADCKKVAKADCKKVKKADCKKADKFCWTVNPRWTHLREYADDEVFQWFKRPDGSLVLVYAADKPGTVYSVSFIKGQKISAGREMMVISIPDRSKAKVKNMESMKVLEVTIR